MLIGFSSKSITEGNLTLRHLSLSDGPLISKLLRHKDVLESSGIKTSRSAPWILFYWWLRRTFFSAYCIEHELQTIGFIGLYNLKPDASAEISLVFFDSACRRKGYGTRSFQMLSRNSHIAEAVNTFIVRVRKKNESSRSFWNGLGFETAGSDGDVLIMTRKRLPEEL